LGSPFLLAGQNLVPDPPAIMTTNILSPRLNFESLGSLERVRIYKYDVPGEPGEYLLNSQLGTPNTAGFFGHDHTP
jgi:hypothetical protein